MSATPLDAEPRATSSSVTYYLGNAPEYADVQRRNLLRQWLAEHGATHAKFMPDKMYAFAVFRNTARRLPIGDALVPGVGVIRIEESPTACRDAKALPSPNGATEARAQKKSAAPAFVVKGWKFPANLNRVERRRIQFSGEVDAATYPGAVFVGTDVPDGPCEGDAPDLGTAAADDDDDHEHAWPKTVPNSTSSSFEKKEGEDPNVVKPPAKLVPAQPTADEAHTPFAEVKKGAAPNAHRSDAPAFVVKGWKFPANLNRLERRRIQFSGEVDAATYPGAVFIGTDVPDGPCEEAPTAHAVAQPACGAALPPPPPPYAQTAMPVLGWGLPAPYFQSGAPFVVGPQQFPFVCFPHFVA